MGNGVTQCLRCNGHRRVSSMRLEPILYLLTNEALKCETLGAVCQKTVQQPKALHHMIASSDYSHK